MSKQNNYSYSIDVSLMQIAIFLIAVVVISFVTFLLGYRAGKSSVATVRNTEIAAKENSRYKELTFPRDGKDDKSSMISEEIQLHRNVKKESSNQKSVKIFTDFAIVDGSVEIVS